MDSTGITFSLRLGEKIIAVWTDSGRANHPGKVVFIPDHILETPALEGISCRARVDKIRVTADSINVDLEAVPIVFKLRKKPKKT